MNGNLLDELRRLSEANQVDQSTFQKIVLAALADNYEHARCMEEHRHPELTEAIDGLKRRDYAAMLIGLLAGLGAIAAAFK